MSTVVVDPITRIEGHLRVETEVDASGKITSAYSSGTMFRGIETILQGRDPRDAWAFVQRICGVCTVVHSMASIRAVENALNYPIPTNARLIRNIMSGSQMVQDQVIHFYQLTSPDWMDVTVALQADPAKTANLQRCMSAHPNNTTEYFTAVKARLDAFVKSGQLGIFANAYWGHPGYKLPPEMNLLLFAHYLETLAWQRDVIKIHSIFGGRNPHPNFIVGGTPCALDTSAAGGVTSSDSAGIALVGALIKKMRDYVDMVHLPDMIAMARFYSDWFNRGDGLGNMLTFGDYPETDVDSTNDPSSLFIPRGAIVWPRDVAGQRLPMSAFRLADQVQQVNLTDPSEIQEFVAHSWLSHSAGKSAGLHPYDGETTPAYTGPKAKYFPHDPAGPVLSTNPEYSWLKTPRWKGNAMEVGPLARVMMLYAKGNSATQALVHDALGQLKLPLSAMYSTMGRLLAEALDTKIIGDRMQSWYDQLKGNIATGNLATHDARYFDPATWPTTAQGVGFTEAPRGALGHWVKIENAAIKNYQCVVPTTWNAAPRDPSNKPSPYEAALVGHTLAVPEQPLEILRTIHSFNPCMACAVHVVDTENQQTYKVTVKG
jgi:hydrogenase large subunit